MTLRGAGPRNRLLQYGWEAWVEVPYGHNAGMPWTPALPLVVRPSIGGSAEEDGPAHVYIPQRLRQLLENAQHSALNTRDLQDYAHRLGHWRTGTYSRATHRVEALALVLHGAARLTLPGLLFLARDYRAVSSWWAAMARTLPPRAGERPCTTS